MLGWNEAKEVIGLLVRMCGEHSMIDSDNNAILCIVITDKIISLEKHCEMLAKAME